MKRPVAAPTSLAATDPAPPAPGAAAPIASVATLQPRRDAGLVPGRAVRWSYCARWTARSEITAR